MKRNRRRVLFVIIGLITTMVATGAPSSIAASDEGDAARSDRLLEQISQTRAVPLDRLESGDETVWEFTYTGKTVFAVKATDRATGKVYLAAVDQDGNQVDLAAEKTADEMARSKQSGNIDPRLAEKLAGMRGNERLRVSIWVHDFNPLVIERPADGTQMSRQAAEDFLEEHLERIAAHNGKVRQGVLKALARMNAKAIEPEYSPVVFADLNRGQIQRLSKRSDVAMMYGPEEYTKFEDDATTTQRAFPTHYGQNFGDSNAARPVIHEDDGVADFNPYLDNDTHPVIYWCSNVTTQCPLGKNVGDHATEVAGVIAADNGLTDNLYSGNLLQRGMAPGVPVVLSANSQDLNSDSQNVAAFEWAIGNKGVPVNMSWGTICFSGQTFSSRYVDWAIRNLFATVVISSGNTNPACSGNPEDLRVSSPGHAWGAITVGAFSDGNTGFHDDDVMAAFSRWQTPNFAGAPTLKPEVVAVGVDVTTTDAQGGDWLTSAGVNGTSFSAPQVSGEVALILRRAPAQRLWPLTTKAAIVASAWQDIEAGTTRDGIGSVIVPAADNIYSTSPLGSYINVFNRVPANFPVTNAGAISGVSGPVKVAVAWYSWSTGGAGTDVLGADLDLVVTRDSDDAFMCSSLSFNNAIETCQFTASSSETYTITTNLFSSDPGWPGTELGVVWNRRAYPNPCTALTNVSESLGVQNFFVNTVPGPTFWDSYSGWGFDQSGKERIFRLVTSQTRDVTLTDTNGGLDLQVFQNNGNCYDEPWSITMEGSAINSLQLNDLPAGVHYIVVDGFAGEVGTTNLTVNIQDAGTFSVSTSDADTAER